jgi:hypothetical protein
MMGVESANYLYRTATLTPRRVADVLAEQGARPMGDAKWVLGTPEHWIDLEVRATRGLGVELSIRVGLPNPVNLLSTMRSLFGALFSVGGGELLDRDRNQTLSALGNAEWEALQGNYLNRKQTFHRRFGDFTAAISGDKLFQYLRERAEK